MTYHTLSVRCDDGYFSAEVTCPRLADDPCREARAMTREERERWMAVRHSTPDSLDGRDVWYDGTWPFIRPAPSEPRVADDCFVQTMIGALDTADFMRGTRTVERDMPFAWTGGADSFEIEWIRAERVG